MRKVVVGRNTKSLEDAINHLENYKRILQRKTITKEFLGEVCKWIINRAKYYVEMSDIGENVKADINNHWSYKATGSSATITNDSKKAVFVEFGVGEVGGQISHPNADNAIEGGYEYNVNNRDSWSFTVKSEADVDLHKGYISKEKTKGRDKGKLVIITKGSWRVMYAYSAIVDARNDLMNPRGEIAKIWESVKLRYFQ